MDRFYQTLSYLGHPLFLLFYFLGLSLFLIPNAYGYAYSQQGLLLVFQSFVTTILLPSVALIISMRLGLISDISLPERKERFLPLVVILTFYLWYFINLRELPFLLPEYRQYSFGVVIGLSLLLLFSSFIKASMHAAGWVLLSWYSIRLYVGSMSFYDFPGQTNLTSLIVFPLVVLLLCGLIIFGRWKIKAHNPKEIGVGIFIGLLSGLLSSIITI